MRLYIHTSKLLEASSNTASPTRSIARQENDWLTDTLIGLSFAAVTQSEIEGLYIRFRSLDRGHKVSSCILAKTTSANYCYHSKCFCGFHTLQLPIYARGL